VAIKGWTVIFKGQRLQAELLAAILEADGVRAEVLGDTPYGVAIDMTDARLLVPDEQAGHARRVLKEAEEAGETEPEDPPEDSFEVDV
jgi:Putative prokaryotic signal transducing protein